MENVEVTGAARGGLRARFAALAIGCALVAFASGANAALDPDREAALATEATDLMARADWAKALPLYSKLYAETHRTGYLWNAAVCQVQLAKRRLTPPEAAIQTLNQYIAAPDASEDKKNQAASVLAEMEQLKRQAAENPTPAPAVAATTGAATAPRLEPSRPTSSADGPASSGGGAAGEGAPTTPSLVAQGDRPAQGHRLRTAALATGAVGVAALIAGGYFSYRTSSIDSDLSSAPQFSKSKDATGETAHSMQFVMYGVGAAALVTAGALYYFSTRTSEGRVALLPWTNARGAGGTLLVRF